MTKRILVVEDQEDNRHARQSGTTVLVMAFLTQ